MSRNSRMASTTDVVQNYQSMFAYRYTAEDKEYQKYLQRSAIPPPLIEDWMNSEPSGPSVFEILQNYKNKFAHRFTSEDEEYQKYVQRPADPPPLVEDWQNRSGGHQRYRDREPSAPSMFEILQNYKNKFAHRFTSEDEEYQKYVQRPADPPPLVEDWRNRSGGHQRYRDRFRDSHQFRNRGHGYDHPGGYRSDQWHEKGYGSNYQQHQHGQSSFPQQGWPPRSYGSYFQEPRYGRY
ncbi:RNA guanine-N7 methyltransferase activating subunit isoform X1 [Crotalus tigris]|uniref:RNA guanine-N7 methyltransferase activating subunit isoform X1 n=2 Tax=Crotalus tigris TaxID=88082 RepID=UPI00192F8315|nr:RNA guanine-N7 methyltransferase activating subunit isoform X1 [Crotalus tigris]